MTDLTSEAQVNDLVREVDLLENQNTPAVALGGEPLPAAVPVPVIAALEPAEDDTDYSDMPGLIPIDDIKAAEKEEEDQEEEEEGEEEEEEEVEETMEDYDYRSSWQLPPDLGLRAAAALSVAWGYISAVKNSIVDMGRKVYRALMPDTYIFFGTSAQPYRMTDVNTSGPAVAPISWYYDADTRFFVSSRVYNNETYYRGHHLPFLSAQIKYHDLCLYDISDFIETVKWVGVDGEKHPPIPFILAAWTLRTGIVVQDSEFLRLEVIDDNGETVSLRFN